MLRLSYAVLVSATAILISLSARAADLPTRVQPAAPVPYVPSFSWTGFYVGGELGWIRTDPEYTTGAVLLGTPFLVSATTGKSGLSYGALAGYNYQAAKSRRSASKATSKAGRSARSATPRSPGIS